MGNMLLNSLLNAPEIMAFGFVLFLMGLLIVFSQGIKFFSKYIKRANVGRLTNASSRKHDGISSLGIVWADVEGDLNTFEDNLGNIVCINKLFEYLQRHFTTEMQSGICTNGRCSYIYKCTSKNNRVFLIQLSSTSFALYDREERPLFSSEYFHLSEVEDMSWGVSILRSAFVSAYDRDVLLLEECINDATLNRVEYPVERAGQIATLRLMVGKDGIELRSIRQNTHPYSLSGLDNSYSDASFMYQGEKHQVPMSKAIPIIIRSIEAGENVGIFGTPGTGKSTLKDIITSEIGRSDIKICPVTISASVIHDWTEDQTKLIHAIQRIRSYCEEMYDMSDARILFILDEAESVMKAAVDGIHSDVHATVLSLLSGELKETFNASCLFVFNAEPAKLNQAIFRSNRISMQLNLKPLDIARATKLCGQIKSVNPDLVFDEKMFQNTCNSINKFPNGEIYADRNQITLSDVYACFKSRDIRRAILDAIRKDGVRVAKQDKEAVITNVPTVVAEVPSTQAAPTPKSDVAPAPRIAPAATNVSIKSYRNKRRRGKN